MARPAASEHANTITRNINSLRVMSVLAILWTVVLLNFNHITLSVGAPTIGLTSTAYVFIILTALLTLAFPNIARLNPVKIVLPVLIALQLAYLMLGISIHLTWLLAEAFALGVTLVLLRELVLETSVTEDILANYLLPGESTHILSQAQARYRVADELALMQQIGCGMTVIYCRFYSNYPDPDAQSSLDEVLLSELSASFLARYLQVRLARLITGITYSSDIVFEYGHGIIVCLPQTELIDGQKFLHQLDGFVRGSADVTLWTSIVLFPQDATTLDELLTKAQAHAKPYVASTELADDISRTGDVAVSIRDRLRIEQKSAWVNRLAYQGPTARAIYRPIKRAMDIVGSGTILLLLSPVLLGIALAIVLNDGRPIFFSHKRVGLGGKTFLMHKFRSMYRNAPPLEPKIVQMSDGTVRYDWPDKDEDDPRVTRIGRFIRKTSLDEVPQLWNVFTGSMSLIGPRPSSWTLEQHTLHQTARLTVKPGLTGLWQVSARDSKNFDERLLWDLKYVEKMGLWLDIQILFRTIGVVLKRTGV